MDRYRTTTALPFAHLSRATALLRLDLGRKLLDAGGSTSPDWSTMRVVGPFETFDQSGAVRFEYRGSVASRRPAALPNSRAPRVPS